MFLACLRTAVSQSTRLAWMRSANVVCGRLAVHARSLSGIARWSRSACLVHTPNCQITGIQWHRHLHTPGDKELEEFLKEEIQMEKKQQKTSTGKLPKIKGFEVTKTDGPNVTLSKKFENEIVMVKFNVNDSIDDSMLDMPDTEQPEADQPQDTKMMSKPAFVVEVNKGGSKKLAMHCVFPASDEYPPPAAEHEAGDPYEDLIEIQDVALLNNSEEWTEDVYSLSASVMDGNLYDMLLKLLEERGIDGDFVDQLTEFSTSYEHNNYVDTLEQLREFVASK